jgi:hypothetical protein
MLRPARAGLVAAVVVATFALAPSAIAERATLRVTAHVVNRCTVAVPPWVVWSEWSRWKHRPGHFVSHSCRGGAPFWVRAEKVWFRHARDHQPAAPQAQQRARHPLRDDVILVTITY